MFASVYPALCFLWVLAVAVSGYLSDEVFTYGGRGPSFRSFRLSGPSRAFLPQIPRTLAMASVKNMIAAGLLAAPCADAFVAPGGSQFSQAVSGLRGSTAVKAESGFSAYSALAVSATTGAAVLSFVGAKKPAARKTVACRFSPEAQIGVTEPLGFFDPAGFCKDEASFKDLRAKELKHGRIWVLDGEAFRFFGLVASTTKVILKGISDSHCKHVLQMHPTAVQDWR